MLAGHGVRDLRRPWAGLVALAAGNNLCDALWPVVGLEPSLESLGESLAVLLFSHSG